MQGTPSFNGQEIYLSRKRRDGKEWPGLTFKDDGKSSYTGITESVETKILKPREGAEALAEAVSFR